MIAIVAALAVGATGAYFSDAQKIGGNTFATGTLKIAGTSNFPLSFTNLAPGGEYTQDIAVQLGGTLPADIYFGQSDNSGADLSPVLSVKIYDVDLGTWVTGYNLASYYSANWTKVAANVSPNSWRNFRVYVYMNPGAVNNYQTLTSNPTVILYATQVDAPHPGTPPWSS